MLEALILGALQGVTEWLPVSSEGVVAVVNAWVFDRPIRDAVAFALWLHVGTAASASLVFRSEFMAMARGFRPSPSGRNPETVFFLVATALSAAVGLPLLIVLTELSESVGSGAMAVIGAAMLVTAALQFRKPRSGLRTRGELTVVDALITGVAQGLAVLPGMSRSGATVAALVARGVERRDALVMSFVLSVPASLAAAVYVTFTSEVRLTLEALVSAAAAGIVGIVTIRVFLTLASRVNVAVFVGLIGLAIIGGVAIQTIG